MLRRSLQSMIEMPPPHHAQYMRLPRIMGGPCSVTASSAGIGSLPISSESVFIHGRPQMLTTSGLSGSLMSSVQITRLSQPGASLGMNASPRSQIDAEAMRSGTRHVVKPDRLRRGRRRHVEDEKSRARVLALVAGEPLRIHVEQIVADDAQLVAMNAGRRAEFADLLRLLRVAHVMHGEAFRPVVARAADRAHIGVPLVHLHQAAAAPSRRRVVAEQAKVLGFFGVGGGHGRRSSLLFLTCSELKDVDGRDKPGHDVRCLGRLLLH